MANRLRTIALERGGLLALTSFLLYVFVAPTHVIDGDNAEFVTLSVTGGAAHPTGYPLFVLWLRAMSWLPGASPAHTAALATSVLGALGVLVLYQACRAWGARAPAATFAAALFATGPVVLRVVTEAEVFALNNLVVASVLWLSAKRGPLRGSWRAAALGLVAGLGLANHVTCAILTPVGLVGIVHARDEAAGRQRMPRVITLAVAGLVLGLTPYLYLLVAPDAPMSWGTVRTFDRLLGVFLREDYGGPFAFTRGHPEVEVGMNLRAFMMTLGATWLWLPALAGLAALGVRIARRAENEYVEPCRGWIALAIVMCIAGPVLVLRFNVVPEGLGLYVNQRFHLLPALLLAVPVAHALENVWSRLSITRPAIVVGLVATVGIIALSVRSLQYIARIHSPAVELGTRNMLRALPPNSLVIHTQDELHFVSGYVQWVLGESQDVAVVMWGLMTHHWYRDRVAARGVLSGNASDSPNAKIRLITNMLVRGRPVFVDRLQRDVLAELPSYPHGPLMRIAAPGEHVPTSREAFELNERLFASFHLGYERPGPDDEYATEVHRRYEHTWKLVAAALERDGEHALAARARDYARQIGPRE